MAGALLAFVVVATFQAAVIPTFQPKDEASHVGYAVELSHGRLPTIDTPIPVEAMPRAEQVLASRDDERRDVWTANHPPLYYALTAIPVRLGLLTEPSLAGVRAARLVSVVFGAIGLVLLALLAGQLVPGRPQVAVAATAIAGVLPTFVLVSSVLYNDSLAFLTTTGTLLAATLVLRRGPSRARIALVAVAASLAALTRSVGLIAAGIAVLAVVAAAWRSDRRPPARRLLAALAGASVVGAAVAATSGWFYARNWRLYGDLTGATALLEKFDRSVNASTFELLRSPGHWFGQVQRVFDYSFYEQQATGTARTVPIVLLALLPAAGLAVLALRRQRGRVDAALAIAWGLHLLLLALLAVSAAEFTSRGGGSHGRYMLPGLAVLAIGAALGLLALPGGRRGLVTVAALAATAVLNVFVLDAWLGRGLDPAGGASALAVATAAVGVPHPALLLVPVGLGVAAGFGMVARALWVLRDEVRQPLSASRGPAAS